MACSGVEGIKTTAAAAPDNSVQLRKATKHMQHGNAQLCLYESNLIQAQAVRNNTHMRAYTVILKHQVCTYSAGPHIHSKNIAHYKAKRGLSPFTFSISRSPLSVSGQQQWPAMSHWATWYELWDFWHTDWRLSLLMPDTHARHRRWQKDRQSNRHKAQKGKRIGRSRWIRRKENGILKNWVQIW